MQDDTGRLERREISVDRMSYKDDGTKQSQDYRDRFGHLALCYYTTLTCSGRSRFQDGFVGSGKCLLFGRPGKNRSSAAFGNC